MLRRLLLAAPLLVAGLVACRGPAPPPATVQGIAPSAVTPGVESPRTTAKAGIRLVVKDVEVLDYGKPIYRGDVDLSATVERILAGRSHSHRNDGSVFQNRERRLPQKPSGYYREYVHPTTGLRGAGPQRIVRGKNGEWYYTPDHYGTFIRLDKET